MKKYIILLLLLIMVLSLSASAQENAVTITYLQNDGVLISNGEDKVLIDALFTPVSGWINITDNELNNMTSAIAPYNDIDLVLITHNHGDHYSIASVNAHLNNNSNARLIAPPQVRSNFSGSQILTVSPSVGQSESLTINGIELEVLHMHHFDAFGNDFSNVQNYGFLIKIGGVNILHLGDVEMTVENLQSFGLAGKNINYVLIPTFNTQAHLQTSHRDALLSQVNPANIIGLHLFFSGISSRKQEILNLYPDAIVFSEPLQSVTVSITGVDEELKIPNSFVLYQNYPNPFNPSTEISYSIPSAGNVKLEVFDAIGSEIFTLVNGLQSAGLHSLSFDGSRFTSGIYFYKLEYNGQTKMSKMLLLK